MTIAIGMRSHSYQPSDVTLPARSTLLICADTMATFVAGSVPVSSSDVQSKIYPLAHGFYAAFSDDYHWSHQVLTELYKNIQELDPTDKRLLDRAKLAVANSFEYAWLWYRREVLRDEVGITEDEFLHDNNLAPDLRQHAQNIWQTKCKEVPTTIIVAGQTPGGPLLLTCDYNQLREGGDYYACGEGSDAALYWMNYRGYNAIRINPSGFLPYAGGKAICGDKAIGR